MWIYLFIAIFLDRSKPFISSSYDRDFIMKSYEYFESDKNPFPNQAVHYVDSIYTMTVEELEFREYVDEMVEREMRKVDSITELEYGETQLYENRK